jgi:predicted MFS family arabinose efflux permease
MFMTDASAARTACPQLHTVQVAVPDDLRGRVMSLYALVFAGVTSIGAFLVGSVAEAYGVPTACALGGGLALALVLAQTGRFYQAQGRLA